MRIVNLTEFRAMPDGTIFCKYHPCVFGELEIKGETWESDFLSSQLTGCVECNNSGEMFDILTDAEKSGKSFNLDLEYYGRDGLYNDEQLFAIYEPSDIKQLIDVLQKSLHN